MATNINTQKVLSRRISGIDGIGGAIAFTDKYSISFDGSNEYLALSSVPLLGTLGTGDFSISLWVNVTNLTGQGNQRLVTFGAGGSYQTAMAVNNTGNLTFSGPWSDQFAWGGTAGNWRHVIYRVNRQSISNNVGFAVDGIIYDNKNFNTTGITFDTTGNGYIGRNAGSYNFAGNIDEIAIWTKYLTNAECVEIYNSGVPTDLQASSVSANLQSWWRMGDPGGPGSYPTIVDQESGNNATMTNMLGANITTNVPTV